MDIDLFADIVKNLILDNDEVTLPGLGTFVSEVMPSTFSDKGYTINPPYRRLSFRQRGNDADSLLVDFYSRTNGIGKGASEKILTEFIAGLKENLQSKKVVALPGLGRLRATKENTFFFIADEDLDIYPYGFGLEPVSLKTHEETPEEVTAAVKELQELVEPVVSAASDLPLAVPGEASGPAEGAGVLPGEPTPEVRNPEEPTPEEQVRQTFNFDEVANREMEGRGRAKPALVVLICLLGLAVLALGTFVLLSRIAPDFIDSLLYTPEELRIINS